MKSATSIMGLADISISDVFDLEGEYNTALSAVQKDGSRQGYFHPSGVGSCGRSQVYEYNKAPFIPETDLGSSEIFDLGHAIHELVGRRLQSVKSHLEAKNIGYRLQLEVPFDPKTDILFSDFRIGGTTDARLDVWADDWAQRSVIEIKSINRANFEKLIKPKHEHLMQAHLYAFRYDCPIIYVWYYCKDTSSKRVFTCLFDPDIFNEAIDYFSGLMDHVIQGSLPERNEDFYMCPRCQYRDICNPPVLLKLKSSKQTKTMTNIRTHRKL